MAFVIRPATPLLLVSALLLACSKTRESSAAQVTRTQDEARAIPASRRTAIT
jgi:hypothetical protein